MATHIWVVQMLGCRGRWSSTVGVGIDREQGRRVLKEWQRRCPDDKFRLRKYVSE